MMQKIKNTVKSLTRRVGYDIIQVNPKRAGFPVDFDDTQIDIIHKVTPYTMTGWERVHALIEAVRYVISSDIKGDFVECGVYKGGSMMAMALTLLSKGIKDRELYFFDTFEGMPAPGERDVDDVFGNSVNEEFSKWRISDVSSTWVNAPMEKVKAAMASTGYPMERMHFIKGMVEDTLPSQAPNTVALLRLDTDWYQSTFHEMAHLYPRLSVGGVTIIDDYGHFKGAKDAVDDYFRGAGLKPFLHRIDYSGRLVIKTK
jgi:hypothetical protein